MTHKCSKMDDDAYKCVIKGTLWCVFVLFTTFYVVADLADLSCLAQKKRSSLYFKAVLLSITHPLSTF